ncbi:MAG TPA: papain-like cysteine protease family protein [Allosphingosinicella sp.]|jgi:hypothetical protein
MPAAVAAFLGPLQALAPGGGPPGAAGHATDPGQEVPGLGMTRQLEDNWCWAAVVAAIVNRNAGPPVTQAEIAVDHIRASGRPACTAPHAGHRNGYDCLLSRCQGDCNDFHSLRQVMSERGIFRTDLSLYPAYLDFARVKSEIGSRRPIACRVDHFGTGHFVLIAGWSVGTDGPRVKILDPATGAVGGPVPSTELPFADFLRRYPFALGTGRVTESYGVV